MMVTYLNGSDEPVFFNFRKTNEEFAESVIFTVETGYVDRQSLGAAMIELEEFKAGTLSYLAGAEVELDDE